MAQTETAYLAGGCFWGMEDLIRKNPGVIKTRVGYMGGHLDHPTYADMKTGATGHAETVEIVFDPERYSFFELLELFFQIHDPSTLNRQGNDRGSQYRSVIFATSLEQAETARQVMDLVDASHLWPGKVVTELVPAEGKTFWLAEDYHQDYLLRNPGGYTCHFPRPNWRLPRPAA